MRTQGRLILGHGFQHTAARRWLVTPSATATALTRVSTHSRQKAAGETVKSALIAGWVSTHSRPKAAGKAAGERAEEQEVSTRSRLKAAGAGRG